MIKQKMLTKQSDNEDSLSPSSIQRHFIQRINHSQLAKVMTRISFHKINLFFVYSETICSTN